MWGDRKRILSVFFAIFFILSYSLAFVVSAEDANVSENSLKGVRVGFYGDSICAANREDRIGWAGRVGEANQMIWTNHGQGGWAISNIRGDYVTICHQLETTDAASYDMIILHGGTNDAWSAAPLGKMSEKFKGYQSYDPITFAGGLEQTFAYVRQTNPDAVVGYIINFKFLNASNGATVKVDGKTAYLLNHMEAYVDMTKQICEKWGIPYLDLYSNDALTAKLHPLDVTGRYSTKYLFDFIHPSTEGYDLLTPYIEDFLIELITSPKPSEEETKTDFSRDTEMTPSESESQGADDVLEKNLDFGCNAIISSAVGVTTGVALCGGLLFCRRGQKYSKLLNRRKTVEEKIKGKGEMRL